MAKPDAAGDDAVARTGWRRPIRAVVRAWALLGGAVLVALVLMTTWSVVSGAVLGQPLPGDFELVEMGVAIAAFAFLPYCQLTHANVTADIFTARAGPRAQSAMALAGALVATAFAALLLWRMWLGLRDYHEYQEYTAIIGIPIWYAFVPILASIVLWILAGLVTLADAASGLTTGRAPSGS